MKKQVRYLVVYLLLGLSALFIYSHENAPVPVNRPLSEIPTQLGSWSMVGQSRFNDQVLKQLKPTDYLYRVYRNADGNRVTLYLGYHSGGPESGPIHSPKHCLPGSGWFATWEGRRNLLAAGEELPVVESIYQNGEQKELFLYYYQVKGKILTDEYSLKLAEIINSALYQRRDSAFVRISVPFLGDQSIATRAGEDFLREVFPHITGVLPL